MIKRLLPFILIMLASSIVSVRGQSAVPAKPSAETPKSSYNLASTALKKGDLDGAIANYTRAITLDPKFANAYGGRAAAKREKGDFEGALADLDRTIELNRGAQFAYVARAWINLILNHGDAAYSDSLTLLTLNSSNHLLFPSHTLIGYFGLRQAKRDAEAEAFLKTWGPKLQPEVWAVQIVRFLGHEISEQQLLGMAEGNQAISQARTYLGLDNSLSGRPEAALTHLRWVTINADKRTFEFAVAVAEIKRIEALAAAKPPTNVQR